MDDTLSDDRLKLMFTCCHPVLALEAQVALTLHTLGGLSTQEGGLMGTLHFSTPRKSIP
jgi:RNA polymerase sigma-70 factor (ECF subfamily)